MAKVTPEMVDFIILCKQDRTSINTCAIIAKKIEQKFGLKLAQRTIHYHLTKNKDRLVNQITPSATITVTEDKPKTTEKNESKETEAGKKARLSKEAEEERLSKVPSLKRKTTKDFDETISDGIDFSLFMKPKET